MFTEAAMHLLVIKELAFNDNVGTPEFIWKLQGGAETTSEGFGGVSGGYKKIFV